MLAYQCDICENFYNHNAYDEHERVDPFTQEPIVFSRRKLSVRDENDAKTLSHDICPTCMNAIEYVCTRINKEGTGWLK